MCEADTNFPQQVQAQVFAISCCETPQKEQLRRKIAQALQESGVMSATKLPLLPRLFLQHSALFPTCVCLKCLTHQSFLCCKEDALLDEEDGWK